jgi:cell division protein FtsW
MWKTVAVLTSVVLILLVVGLIMVFSSSAASAEASFGDSKYFVLRQGVWAGFGLVLMLLFARIDYHRWRWMAVPVVLSAIALLVLVRIPGIGREINGSWRWLRFGSVSLQPSEFAKFAVILFLAWWLKRERRNVETFTRGFLYPGMVLAGVLLLIFVEPDFGTALLIAMTGGLMLFYGGTSLRFLLPSAAVGAGLFGWAVMRDAERMGRVLSFLDPEKYISTDGWQLMNALYGFVVGGLHGAGLGESLQKRFYLPEAHTDFIFAIIGEELGLMGTIGILSLFLILLLCGIHITVRAPDYFGRMLSFGVTVAVAMQALINIAVVTGSVPTKGMALPFISYGGSSLLVFLSLIGLQVNIARHVGDPVPDPDIRAVKDQVHAV